MLIIAINNNLLLKKSFYKFYIKIILILVIKN